MGRRPPQATDRLGRPIRELRVSVTDRCNFRCVYCMPRGVAPPGARFLPPGALLSFEDIERVVRAAKNLGVVKVRLTGGEPLLRPGLPDLVARLAAVGGLELTLTTNGSLLSRHARALKAAGLSRATVSLDALDPAAFAAVSDSLVPLSSVLDGIDAALEAGLAPVKINVVLRRGLNEAQVLPLARRFRWTGCVVRFIEYMDAGSSNGWRPADVVPGGEVLAMLCRLGTLEAVPPTQRGEVARRFRWCDGGGEIGLITAVTQPFCRGCTRARLSAHGVLYTCLFAPEGVDLRTALGSGNATTLRETVLEAWRRREDRYSELRSLRPRSAPRVEMSRMGG